ncbi:sigma-70 family RNA polymerase sigma factor [Acidisoma sp.]|uniref:sigma-70 family RNA polymerase sigma factor n=1 Tax=Acidisoma sp. TaxID=1872115 RepID=UPI003AFFD049
MSDMARLIEPLIPALRRYARALVRDAAAADDLVQDCLERTISRWNQRRDDGDTRAWMFTILHNLAINRLRQKSRRGHHIQLDDADDSAMAEPAAQEDGIRQTDIMAAVNRLPEDQRSVLLLVSVEELSYADAARVLDVPVGTVMSRLARARERLRRMMQDDHLAMTSRSHLRSVK